MLKGKVKEEIGGRIELLKEEADETIERLAEVYKKLKGTVFLRYIPASCRHYFKTDDIARCKDNPSYFQYVSNPEGDDGFGDLLVLARDMTFSEWLTMKGVAT